MSDAVQQIRKEVPTPQEGFEVVYQRPQSLTETQFTLDHVHARAKNGPDHSYRNLVACCFECNSSKQASDANEWLRVLYRTGLLSADEHAERQAALERLSKGELRPYS